MNLIKSLATFMVSLSFVQCTPDRGLISPSNSNLVYEGRVVLTDESAAFCYPGTAVRMAFTGSSVSASLKPNSGYYWVEIDSLPAFKLSTFVGNKENNLFLLADSLGIGNHTVQLTLINEGLNDKPEFYGFALPSPNTVKAVPAKAHRIEFIGNSMTCGYGVEAPNKECGFADSTENFALAYAGIVSRRFNAAAMVVARSGIGVYRNFNDTITGSEKPMPSFYDNAFIFDSPKWDFSQFEPEIVCICLGTNDLSVGEYDLNRFQDAYLKFAQHIQDLNPKAKLILISGSMLNGQRLADQCKVLDYVAFNLRSKGGNDVYRFNFTPQDGSLGYGADWHPSLKQQQRMADELTQYIESIDSNWKPANR